MKPINQDRRHNGQAFILHIWDDLDCKIEIDSDDWSPGFTLINYLTHKVGACAGFVRKLAWTEYVENF